MYIKYNKGNGPMGKEVLVIEKLDFYSVKFRYENDRDFYFHLCNDHSAISIRYEMDKIFTEFASILDSSVIDNASLYRDKKRYGFHVQDRYEHGDSPISIEGAEFYREDEKEGFVKLLENAIKSGNAVFDTTLLTLDDLRNAAQI